MTSWPEKTSPPGSLPDDGWASYPWPDGPWLRACMVMTVDGAFHGPDGLSRSISGPADRAVLSRVRSWADAVLVGAGTIRAERYRPLRTRPELALARRQAGRPAAPRLVVVSAALNLDLADPLFRASAVTPLLVTSQRASGAAIVRARRRCPVLVLPGADVAPVDVVRALQERGMGHIVCEGGPGLLAQFLAADLVDELDLTLSPLLAGPRGSGSSTPTGQPVRRLELAGIRVEEGFVFTRYLRASSLEAGRTC